MLLVSKASICSWIDVCIHIPFYNILCFIKQGGVDHAHAFVLNPEVTRFCSVTQARGGTVNILSSYA